MNCGRSGNAGARGRGSVAAQLIKSINQSDVPTFAIQDFEPPVSTLSINVERAGARRAVVIEIVRDAAGLVERVVRQPFASASTCVPVALRAAASKWSVSSR
jgi:hypothetical protein